MGKTRTNDPPLTLQSRDQRERSSRDGLPSPPPAYTVIDEHRATPLATRIRIAGTSRARRKGLLGVNHLEPGAGIWIAPCEAVHTFGMKIPIDVVFLGRDHTVKKIVPRLKSWRIAACLTAASALELEPGAAERAGLRVGARLRFEPAA